MCSFLFVPLCTQGGLTSGQISNSNLSSRLKLLPSPSHCKQHTYTHTSVEKIGMSCEHVLSLGYRSIVFACLASVCLSALVCGSCVVELCERWCGSSLIKVYWRMHVGSWFADYRIFNWPLLLLFNTIHCLSTTQVTAIFSVHFLCSSSVSSHQIWLSGSMWRSIWTGMNSSAFTPFAIFPQS